MPQKVQHDKVFFLFRVKRFLIQNASNVFLSNFIMIREEK